MILEISQTLDLEMTDTIEITDEASGTGNTDSVTCIVRNQLQMLIHVQNVATLWFVEKQMENEASGDQSYVSYVLMKNKLNLKDVKQIDVHAERLDKCAIVDAIQILLVKINECIYHFFFVKCFMWH